MLKHQYPHHRQISSSPRIDSMFLISKLSTNNITPLSKAERDQISEIRNMGRVLFDQQFDEETTLRETYNNQASIESERGNQGKDRMNLYERGKASESRKWERIVQTKKKQAKKIESLANTSRNTLNKTTLIMDDRSRKNQLREQNHQKKQSYVIKQVLKKCIKEEQQLYQLKQQEKGLNYSKTNMYLKNNQHPPNKPKVGKEELKKIFEQVNKRGDELRKRKQLKIQKYQQQKKQKEMEGVTFYPSFQSTSNLRKNCTKGFLERLKQDDYNREKQKIELLATQLKKDSFQPKLNNARNSLSKSKIDSFRLEDSIFLTHRHKAEQQFEKSLSRFVFAEEEQFRESRNQSLQIAVNSKELNFLFQ